MQQTLAEQYAAVRSLSSVLQALRLNALHERMQQTDGGTAGSAEVAAEITQLLDDAQSLGPWLHDQVKNRGDEVEAELAKVLDQALLVPEVRRRFHERFIEQHGITQLVSASTQQLPGVVEARRNGVGGAENVVVLSSASSCAVIGFGLGLVTVGAVVEAGAALPAALALVALADEAGCF